ncbi:cell wall hydrolase [Salimicrobium flavidum]|uniref:N-acetylmuramoyl-L-alanine amidase n=1 Tax=Salimicrobium flavidum TaxID=570947 RepID=A0A1N7J7F3_9BACI|nr:cell wall hydrolase [Salimicrobium flavidum]SIS45197.1 N-acetylmuramoyl-L-alanine amidase [Salimicrobium flavidum]
MKKVSIVSLLMMLLIPMTAHADWAHVVHPGESYYSIASQYGVNTHQLQSMNNDWSSYLSVGERVQVPVTLNSYEKDLLARLVEAEAKGESYAGKVAVATVVLNRVESNIFPDTLYNVVYDGRQFSPVLNGTINQPAGAESKQAVEEALDYQGYDNGSLYFYNPDKAESAYLASREVTVVIGNEINVK